MKRGKAKTESVKSLEEKKKELAKSVESLRVARTRAVAAKKAADSLVIESLKRMHEANCKTESANRTADDIQRRIDGLRESERHASERHAKLLKQCEDLQSKSYDTSATLAQLLTKFSPSNGSIKLSPGEFPMASTFTVKTGGFFLLNEFNTIIESFRKHGKTKLVFVMNEKLLLLSFGSTNRNVTYNDTVFMVSNAVADDKVIVLANQFAP